MQQINHENQSDGAGKWTGPPLCIVKFWINREISAKNPLERDAYVLDIQKIT